MYSFKRRWLADHRKIFLYHQQCLLYKRDPLFKFLRRWIFLWILFFFSTLYSLSLSLLLYLLLTTILVCMLMLLVFVVLLFEMSSNLFLEFSMAFWLVKNETFRDFFFEWIGANICFKLSTISLHYIIFSNNFSTMIDVIIICGLNWILYKCWFELYWESDKKMYLYLVLNSTAHKICGKKNKTKGAF